MKLAKYLKANDISVIAFAKSIRKSRGAVYSYLSKERSPSPAALRKIYKVTGKQVAPEDFILTGKRK